MIRRTLDLALAVALATPALAQDGEASEARKEAAPDAGETYGFDLSGLTVDRALVVPGGPGPDGIQSVDEPAFAPAEEATWIGPATTVIGLVLGGEARAYPVHLMEYHQIVNDTIGGRPVAVTYDPIAGTPRAFRREVGDRTLAFGVSGLLYHANFLLYDRETRSLWSQFEGRAVAGPLAGKGLDPLRVRQEASARWLERHPQSGVLERPARLRIDYRYSPFQRYWTANRIPFPVAASDESRHAKELVLGLGVDGKPRAYLGSLVTASGGFVEGALPGRPFRIWYDPENAFYSWEVPEDVEVTEAYWFAWKAFRPDSEVWLPATPPPAGD